MEFVLPEREASGTPARLVIHDALGRTVRVLEMGRSAAGSSAPIPWDGLAVGGAPVAPGIYFARLEGEGRPVTARFVIAR